MSDDLIAALDQRESLERRIDDFLQGRRLSDEALSPDQYAGIITDWIIADWQQSYLRRILKRNSEITEKAEVEAVLNRVEETLDTKEKFMETMLNRLTGYLEQNDRLIVDGFIQFRLRDYVAYLDRVLQEVVNEHVIERDYREFIRLLQYFVEIQEPYHPRAEVFVDDSGGFSLYDGDGVPIEEAFIDEFVDDMVADDFARGDLLVSVLITLAPDHLSLHGSSHLEDESREILGAVFKENIEICSGCGHCNPLIDLES